MKILVLAVFVASLLVAPRDCLGQQQLIPSELVEEMAAEQPKHLTAIQLAPLLASVILHFPRANLFVVTKIRMVAPEVWTFRDGDIELISRKVGEKLIVLYRRKERA